MIPQAIEYNLGDEPLLDLVSFFKNSSLLSERRGPCGQQNKLGFYGAFVFTHPGRALTGHASCNGTAHNGFSVQHAMYSTPQTYMALTESRSLLLVSCSSRTHHGCRHPTRYGWHLAIQAPCNSHGPFLRCLLRTVVGLRRCWIRLACCHSAYSRMDVLGRVTKIDLAVGISVILPLNAFRKTL